MAEKKKSIIDEAVLDAKRIQETLNANTKEILRSIAKEEIDELVKESLNEFDEEDVDDGEVDVDVEDDALDADSETEIPTDEPIDSIGDVSGDEMPSSEEGGLEDYEDGMGAEEVPSGEEMDMTTASDDEVIAVYKKLTGDDEIQIVSNEAGDIELTVTEPGEFVIKTDGEAGEVEGMGDMDAEIPAVDYMGGEELPTDDYDEMGDISIELDSDDEEEEETYDEGMNESQVVYEIAIDEMDDIESASNNVPTDNETSGDNLEGGFDDEGHNDNNGDNHGEHIMEDDVNEEDIDEKIQVGKGRNVTTNKTDIEGAGGKANKVKAPNVTAPNATNEYVSKAAYDKLLSEAKALKSKAKEMAVTLQEQRKTLAKVVVFNTNLTNVTRLFTEHSTTREEKSNIIERFDDEVSTIQESRRLYKTINKELSSKTPISESVEGKISKEKSSSSSKLNENTAYIDQGTKRIMDLMRRVENPDKY